MTNQVVKKYNLVERFTTFSEKLIELLQTFERNTINNVLIGQCIRSGTSIGANYCEADEAESKRDFIHKLGISRKEARETQYWLRLLAKANPNRKTEIVALWQETQEFILIIAKSIQTARKNLHQKE